MIVEIIFSLFAIGSFETTRKKKDVFGSNKINVTAFFTVKKKEKNSYTSSWETLDAQMGTKMILFDKIHTRREGKGGVWDLGFKFIQYEHFGCLFGTLVISV